MIVNHDDRQEFSSKEIYESVCRVVEYQTSAKQPRGCQRSTVRSILSGGKELETERVDKAIRAAIQNGELVGWRDIHGDRRLALHPGDSK